jgi:hypothetical protein
VQQPGCLCPPLVLGGSGAVVVAGGRNVQVPAMAAGCRPEQEVSRLAGSWPGAEPQVNVCLPARGQTGAAVTEPGEQAHRGPDVVTRVSSTPPAPMPGRRPPSQARTSASQSAQASDILDRLQQGSMPCDGAWPAEGRPLFSAASGWV